MANSRNFSFDSAWKARSTFFDDGLSPDDHVPREVSHSWTRCRDFGLSEHEKLAFEPVHESDLRDGGERNRSLVTAADEQIKRLGLATRGTGYAALLTDVRGHALLVSGDVEVHGTLLRRALRAGVNLSEAAIGTSAMVTAIHERRPARIYGPEHFCLQMQSIYCAAAPIFGINGDVIGAVDISSDMAPPNFDALAIVKEAAHTIQRSILRAIPAMMHLRLHWDGCTYAAGALIAVGPDGEIIAMDESARALLGLRDRPGPIGFANVFDRMFGGVADIVSSGRVAEIRRLGGLRFTARLDDSSNPRMSASRLPLACADGEGPDFASMRAIAALESGISNRSPNDLKSLETQAMIDALLESRGNISAAARQLGISRATIHRRLRREDV